MRTLAVTLAITLLLAACGQGASTPQDDQATPEPANPVQQVQQADSQPPAPEAETETESPPDDLVSIAQGLEEGMDCEDALAQLPEPAGSFSGQDVQVTGINLPQSDENRISYVWELDGGQALILTCLDGKFIGTDIMGGH